MTEIQGLEALTRKLKTLENFQRKMKPPMDKSVAIVVRWWGRKPRKKAGAFSAMASRRQQIAYWAKVSAAAKAGTPIHDAHGYMRSNQIVNSLSGNSSMSLTKVTTSGSGVRGIIGTNAPGAEFVIGSERQQRFHAASGWRTDEQAIEEKADDIQKLFDAVVKRELNR